MTYGDILLKPNAKKIRRVGDSIIVGFAGVTADALCLFELLEQKLEAYPDQLLRACVEMAKSWRLGRDLRRLEATMIVASTDISLTITGAGTPTPRSLTHAIALLAFFPLLQTLVIIFSFEIDSSNC